LYQDTSYIYKTMLWLGYSLSDLFYSLSYTYNIQYVHSYQL